MGNEYSLSENDIISMMISPDLSPIGAGGYGKVYTHPAHHNLAIKKSKDEGLCKDWSNEYNIQKEIASYNDLPVGFFSKHSIIVVNPHAFVMVNNTCFLVMDRVCPLGSSSSKEISNIQGKSVHALLGSPSHFMDNKDRGIFLGRKQLNAYLNNLTKIIKELGSFMAYVHYKLGYDANDIEVIIGKDCLKNEINLYILDFGMVGNFTVNGAVSSLSDMEYFPYPVDERMKTSLKMSDEDAEENNKLYDIFKKEYLLTAEKYGKLKEGTMVISEFE